MKHLKNTIGMMLSNDFKDRAKAEYHQLKIICEKLEDMCKKYAAGELNFTPNCSLELLQEQLDYMLRYKGVLEQRAKIEEIDLEDEEISEGEGTWALVTIGDEKCSMVGNNEKLMQILLEGLEIKFGKSEEISKSFECDEDCADCCDDTETAEPAESEKTGEENCTPPVDKTLDEVLGILGRRLRGEKAPLHIEIKRNEDGNIDCKMMGTTYDMIPALTSALSEAICSEKFEPMLEAHLKAAHEMLDILVKTRGAEGYPIHRVQYEKK